MTFLAALRSALGDAAVLTEPALIEPYVTDWRGAFAGTARAVARPANTQEVASVVRLCAEHRVAVVPQGGNTGLAAGATPLGLKDAIVLNLSRMNRIRDLDAAGFTIAVDAGCILANVQNAAREADRLFPLSLAAEGSAQIGGLISTNAGGTAVLRYGTMRSLVLGLEVVLADGEIAEGMRALRKDNAGYDWKQLFIGSEGTLGIVTGAVLRLFPCIRERVIALLGAKSCEAALRAFARLQSDLGETLSACELFSEACVALRLSQHPQLDRPIAAHPWYLLIEAGSSLPGLHDAVEAALAGAIESGEGEDCVVATSPTQGRMLWEWRESISESERRAGPSAKHDVSVAISAIPAFIEESTEAVERRHAGARVLAFGHVGDGNVHFNVVLDPGIAAADVNRTVHEIVKRYRGSITAEHGIGRYRRDELREHRSATEMYLMYATKDALDPACMMNPGAVL